MAQGSGARFNSGNFGIIRVPTKNPRCRTVIYNILLAKKTSLLQDGVERPAPMPLAEDKKIPFGPKRFARVHPQNFGVEVLKYVDDGKGAGNVTFPGATHHLNYRPAQILVH
jgi:hypothetical protein